MTPTPEPSAAPLVARLRDAINAVVCLVSNLRPQMRREDAVQLRGAWDDVYVELQAVAAALETAQPTTIDPTHPEAFCDRCHRPNVVWSAPNELWNRVMPNDGIVCPVCFVQAAEAVGIHGPWRLAPAETAQQGEGDRPVTDADVEAVEAALGMGHGAWDMLDPKTIIAAARRAAPTPERDHA